MPEIISTSSIEINFTIKNKRIIEIYVVYEIEVIEIIFDVSYKKI